MKTLYIVRHAKAVPHSNHDFERTLAERGEKEAGAMGDKLRQREIHPTLILTSPAARTKATADLIAHGIQYDVAAIATDRRLYNAEPDKILRVVRETSAEIESLMIVGHNPGITEFANGIFRTAVTSFPTCGVAGGSVNVQSWKDLKWGSGDQEFFEEPD